MEAFGKFLKFVAVIALVACIVFGWMSFDKYLNYNTYRHTNEYVGGDAYNYIINGTYFTSFAVYAVGCAIISVVSSALGSIMTFLSAMADIYIHEIKKQDRRLEKENERQSS